MTKDKQRAEYMSNQQKAQMDGMQRKYKTTARTHWMCEEGTGVHRPGKTAKDKAQGSWKSKQVRNAAHEARREALVGGKRK